MRWLGRSRGIVHSMMKMKMNMGISTGDAWSPVVIWMWVHGELLEGGTTTATETLPTLLITHNWRISPYWYRPYCSRPPNIFIWDCSQKKNKDERCCYGRGGGGVSVNTYSNNAQGWIKLKCVPSESYKSMGSVLLACIYHHRTVYVYAWWSMWGIIRNKIW